LARITPSRRWPHAVAISRADLLPARRPIGSFFFLGPTGTGKTELAKAIAAFLFNDESFLIRFDMSEFGEKHAAERLIGAPPGYVGYEEGGVLVDQIREKPTRSCCSMRSRKPIRMCSNSFCKFWMKAA
jgi:ATP-dependent Clp protease ATP-binding subunit ClpA